MKLKKQILLSLIVVILSVGVIFLIVRAGQINPPPAAWDPETQAPNPTMKPLSSLAGFAHTGLNIYFDEEGNERDLVTLQTYCDSLSICLQDQDAHYYYPLSYQNNQDGTVTDMITGLTWQQDGLGLGTWAQALTTCYQLDLGGHDDWRLPNIKELMTIVDYSRNQPTIDPIFTTETGYYWSATTLVSGPSDALVVDFALGYEAQKSSKSSQHYVRCVRP